MDYAEISSNIDEMRTALEEAIGGAGVPERIVAGASRLRGYSWFVGFHSRLLDGAGTSVSAIENSGAFESVRLLDNGVLLLRAVESDAAFDDSRVRAVFEVLRPLLPSGMPKFDENYGDKGRYPIVYEDARG